MSLKIRAVLAVVFAACIATAAYAAGLFATLPIIGGGAYCAATNVVGPAQQTITTTGAFPATPPPPGMLQGFPGNPPGAVPVVCQSNVPPGPQTIRGTENFPADIYPPGEQVMAGGAQTALLSITQLGSGALYALDMPPTPPLTAFQVPPTAGIVVLDTGAGATATVNLPTPAIDGEIVSILCNGGGATSLTIAAIAPQTIVTAPAAGACAIGTIYKFRYVAQATGAITAGTWLRIQ